MREPVDSIHIALQSRERKRREKKTKERKNAEYQDDFAMPVLHHNKLQWKKIMMKEKGGEK